MNKLQLEVGKNYVARNGTLVKIVNNDGHFQYPFDAHDGRSYQADGLEYGKRIPSERDLISEFSAAPTAQATADAIFADAEQQLLHGDNPKPVGILGATATTEQRNKHIAQIILRGMDGMDTGQIRDFINLYDSAVDGTSQPVKAA